MHRRGKAVVPTVNVGDRDARELFVRYVFEAAKIDAVHHPYGRFGSHTIGAHAAHFAEVVLVLRRVEQVLRERRLPGKETKPFGLCDRWPEACSPAYRTVAPIRTLREIEISLELHGTTVATPMIGSLHL